MNTIFIGIAGGTGSGKTTLTEHLAARFGSDISVVHHDNYYKRQDRPFAERCLQNYDHPDAFDTDLMIEDLKALKRGETIHCPVYDYAIHNRTDETVEIKPTKVVIVEDILIFQNKALRDLLDIKIFVETDADVRILRRALRDGGRFLLCQRPEQLAEILAALRAARLEPKRLAFVKNRPDAAPWLFLVEAQKGRKTGLRVEPDILIQSGAALYGPNTL